MTNRSQKPGQRIAIFHWSFVIGHFLSPRSQRLSGEIRGTMAHLFPFQAYRYNKDIVPDLGRVVTQPYDKISPQMQEEYYRRSPYSAAQITKNLEKNQNPDTEYPAAAATLR